MDGESKGRGRPMPPDAGNIGCKLEEMLSLEGQHEHLSIDRTPEEVSLTARDGSVHILRCLKVLFDLEEEVFFTAVCFLDAFLARMKVQQKFLACVTISCLHMASVKHKADINLLQLVSVSQAKCSVKDLLRMSSIIQGKLFDENNSEDLVTVFDFVMLFLQVLERIAVHMRVKLLYDKMLQYDELLTRLEIVMADSTCSSYRPSVIALALIHTNVEQFLSKEISSKSPYYFVEMLQLLTVVAELQTICLVVQEKFISCYQKMGIVLKEYDSNCKSCHKQKLVWRFSSCTLNAPKPSENFFNALCTIPEE